MEGMPLQMKTLIHHILYRHKIYRLQMNQIQEVLYLLEQNPSQEPEEIQELIFKGVKQFNQIHGDNVGVALSQQKFNEISNQTKVLMHKVLHQFFFLNSIRAFEMFQSHFQQPALHSLSERGEATNQILDDQFEKTKLHYMYYGPLSVYNFNQASQPYYNNVTTNNFTHFDPISTLANQTLLNAPNIHNQAPKPRGRPPLNISKPPNSEEVGHSEMSGVRVKNTNRGRPPKIKKVADERLNIQSLEQQQQQLGANVMEYQKQEQNKLLVIEQCICKGLKKSGKMNQCECGRRFHLACSQDQKFCFYCKQLRADPFNRVVSLIRQFIANFEQNLTFEGTLDLQHYQFVFSSQQNYQIMVSSANPNFSGICWPDDIVFSLNGQPVFQIPALLISHHQARRADSFLNITSHISSILQNRKNTNEITFKFQVKQFPQDERILRRNNRQGEFLINFFLVNPLTPNDLIKEIEQKNANPSNIGFTNSTFNSLTSQKDCIVQKQYLSLLDPYTCQMMKIPAKGSKCTHLRSFDLKNFINLMYSVENKNWQCPYCHKDARDLVIDNFALNLLNEMKRNEKFSSKVIVYSNGRVQYGQSEGQEMDFSGKSNEP